MRRSILLALALVLTACGSDAEATSEPAAESAPAPAEPAAEAEAPSEGRQPIHEDGFEAGDEREWSESVVAPDDEDDEPDVP